MRKMHFVLFVVTVFIAALMIPAAFAQDAVFYVQVDLQNAPDDTTLKAVWTAVEAQDTEPGLVITETEFATGDGLVHFTLSNDNLWPIGKYKVDIYLNNQLTNTVEFEVQ